MSGSKRKAAATLGDKPSQTRTTGDAAPRSGEIAVLINGVPLPVSPELEAAVHRAYKGLLAPLPAEMTTSQAAEFLDVSRPFVVKVIKQGGLPYRMVGKHHRIPTAALVEYREKMFHRAKKAADEMARMSQDLGLYDEERPTTAK
jgi:excisionase family DNA binding protein